jgi:hypothetical protein
MTDDQQLTFTTPSLTAFQALLHINQHCQFMSIEVKSEKASNSEIKRWLNQGAIHVNSQAISATDPWPPMIRSLVMFPKSPKRRCTLIWNPDVHLVQIKDGVSEPLKKE